MPRDLDETRWLKLPFVLQLGNLGSEISRAQALEQQEDFNGRKMSLERALELLDATIKSRVSSGGVRELLRLREVLAGHYLQSRTYRTSLGSLLSFCLPFAFLARKRP